MPEAPGGVGPPCTVLQTVPWPLGHGAFPGRDAHAGRPHNLNDFLENDEKILMPMQIWAFSATLSSHREKYGIASASGPSPSSGRNTRGFCGEMTPTDSLPPAPDAATAFRR